MNTKPNRLQKNLHLLISIVIVVPVGIIYGSPKLLPSFLDIDINSVDLANMLKAVMCLYLGISAVWFVGIWEPKYWKAATQLNILFMLSLAIGRVISMILDGMPSEGYLFGLVDELILGIFSIYQLKKYSTLDSSSPAIR